MQLAKVLVVCGLLVSACSVLGSEDEALLNNAGAKPPGAPGSGGAKGDAPPGTPVVTGMPCDVSATLQAKCQGCHGATPQYGASAPLVTYDDLQKTWGGNGKKVHELVAARIADDARPMPPTPNARLEGSARNALVAWSKAGAPASTDACTRTSSSPQAPSKKELSCKPDLVLKAAKPFTMAAGSPADQYVCFGMDVNVAKKRHITALAPHVDNTKILHHVLVFQSPQAESPEPTPCESFGSASWKLITGWAPGGENMELPPEAGFPQEQGTTHWVVQLHYNNALNLAGATDNSGYELCTTEQLRPNDAGVLAFGTTSINLPPRSKTAVSCDYRLDNNFKDVKFFNASPHMHKLGTAMSTHRLPGGNGAPEKVLDVPTFNFENQAALPATASVQPGDVIRTRCAWNNTTDQKVGFGEGTGDEMCFDFVGYYPNIPDRTLAGFPVFTWITPSQSARCTKE